MRSLCSNRYVKSFTARPFPSDSFPNLVVRSCISEASESLNGPRYVAQDQKTSDVYEIRYIAFEPRDQERDQEDEARMCDSWARQEERMDQLRSAGLRRFPFVLFPHSIFVFDEGDGKYGVASAEEFSGLSLGDIVRSGWTLIEESLLNDVLEAVEAFGKMSPLLPPHGNLSADSIKQLLTAREVTVEALPRPRWVVCDWLLTEVKETYDVETSISDLEWMLNSTFSQFRIQSDANDTFLSPSELEGKIGFIISNVRKDLTRRFSGLTHLSGMSLANSSLEEEIRKLYKPGPAREVPSKSSTLEKTRYMSVKEKIAFHQGAQRDEQQQLNRYRRRHAQLPPRPNQRGEMMDFSKEDEDYTPHQLDSPIAVAISSIYQEEASDDTNPRQKVMDDIVHLAVMYEDRVRRERRSKEDEIEAQREALRAVLARSAALGATRGRSFSLNGRTESRPEYLSFSSPAVSLGLIRKAESEANTPGPNPNSRRRTLNGGGGSRPQTARKTSSSISSAIEKTPTSVSGGLSQTYTANTPVSVSQIGIRDGKLQPILNAKRKDTFPGQILAPAENTVPFVVPLPLNCIQNVAVSNDGVNVPPQHSVRGSPRGPSNADAIASDFPMAPQSITIGGETVPPRRSARQQAKYQNVTFSKASVAAAPEGTKAQTSPNFLPKTLFRSNVADMSARNAGGGLLKTVPQGVRSFCQDLPKKDAKRKSKNSKESRRRRLGESDGVTRGSIRTVTESSIPVPKNFK